MRAPRTAVDETSVDFPARVKSFVLAVLIAVIGELYIVPKMV